MVEVSHVVRTYRTYVAANHLHRALSERVIPMHKTAKTCPQISDNGDTALVAVNTIEKSISIERFQRDQSSKEDLEFAGSRCYETL